MSFKKGELIMISKRLLETIAMLMIGDSVLAMLSPRRHLSLWLDGPRWWQRTCQPLVGRPRLIRVLGLLGCGLGLWLAWHEEKPARAPHSRSRAKDQGWRGRLAGAMQ